MRRALSRKNKKGFTLIEALVLVFLVAVIVVTFYQVFNVGMVQIIESKNRLGAVALANEKMEIVRNLNYDNIGTKKQNADGGYSYGIPPGDILEDEVVVKNTRTYYIHTFVQFIDDPYDGTQGGSSSDLIPNDYKKVEIKVAWDSNPETSKFVYSVSTFTPSGVEKSIGGGTLSINVINNQGEGIPQALVHITNSVTGTDINTSTDSTGNITLVGAPAGERNYSIQVSKSGYYSVGTYPPYPDSDWQPVDEDASVVEGQLNVKSIITDKTSSLTVNTKDAFGNSIPNIGYTLSGGRKIGDTVVTLPDIPEPVYDYENHFDSGSDGRNTVGIRSFGVYTFQPDDNSGYYFAKIDNDQTNQKEIDLPPGTDLSVNAVFLNKNINSLFVTVFNDADEAVVYNASVELKSDSLGYSTTLTTDRYGQVYFPESLPELQFGTYSLTVKADGFNDSTTQVDIDKLTSQAVKLTAS